MTVTRYQLIQQAVTLQEHARLCRHTAHGRYVVGEPHGEVIIFECPACGFMSRPYVLELPKKEQA